MRTSSFLQKLYFFVILLTTTYLFSQDIIRDFEPLPSNSEKLNLVYPKAYRFNSYKIKIPNYGVAKIKENAPDTDAIKEQNISIDLTDLNHNTVTIKAKSVQDYVHSTEKHYLENNALRMLKTGHEVDTEELRIDSIGPKMIEGAVITNQAGLKNWNIRLVKVNNSPIYLEMGSLTNGERTIKVIQQT